MAADGFHIIVVRIGIRAQAIHGKGPRKVVPYPQLNGDAE